MKTNLNFANLFELIASLMNESLNAETCDKQVNAFVENLKVTTEDVRKAAENTSLDFSEIVEENKTEDEAEMADAIAYYLAGDVVEQRAKEIDETLYIKCCETPIHTIRR